ncbi:unnamed protein product [Arctogadus glacialis]
MAKSDNVLFPKYCLSSEQHVKMDSLLSAANSSIVYPERAYHKRWSKAERAAEFSHGDMRLGSGGDSITLCQTAVASPCLAAAAAS